MESYLVTQLFTACTRGDLESVKRLIELRISPWIRDNQGNTLFHLCCSSVQCGLDVLQYLITVSNSVNYSYLVNNEQQTLLHLACHSGKLDFVKYLFNHHFGSFTSLDIYGHTPLYYACSSRHYNIVSFICNNVTVLSPDIIYQCVKISTWEIMVPLLKKISFKDFMVRVIQEERVDLAKLVTKDNFVQWLDIRPHFPLHYFATLGDIVIINFLITKVGFDLEAEDSCSNRPLHIACAFSGNVDLVRYLVQEAGCDINARGFEGRTILHRACEKGQLEIIRFLIAEIKCDLEANDRYGNKPLHIACAFSGSVNVVRYLIQEAGCDLNARGFENRTILHRACEKNNFEVVKFLVTEIKCDLEAEDRNSDRPLHIACAVSGSVDLVRYLIQEAGCDINASGFEGRTILHKACEKNHLGVVKFLISEIKCDLEAQDRNNDRPLHIACAFSDSVDLVSYLIKVAGCDINAKGFNGRTIFHKACEKNHLGVVKYLITKMKCNLEAGDRNSDRPLHIACALSGSIDLVRYLINAAGCDINARGFEGRTILHKACEKNHLGVVKYLVTVIKCSIEAEDRNGDRPLHIACAVSGSVELVSFLIRVAGCEINARGFEGRTILHKTCEKNHLGVVKYLVTVIKCGIEAEDRNGDTPLHIACSLTGSIDLVSCLIKVAGCDINARGFEGRTILHKACEKNHFGLVKFLVTEIKCDLEANDRNSDTPLHIACACSGSVNLVRYLIQEAGCNINARGFENRTILHRACEKNHLEVVKFLITDINCDFEAEDAYSNKPLHIACACSSSAALVRYLIQKVGCDKNARGFENCTILHRACEKNNLEVVKFLITEIKCDLEAEDENSNRPLHIACACPDSVELVSYLIKVAGCDISARGFQGRTILHMACEMNYLEVVKFLVTEIKCDLEAEDRNGDRPLHIACAVSGSVDLVRYLIQEAGCDINTRGFKGRTILHKACEKNHLGVVKFLISEIKCDLEAQDRNNDRPLHIACAFFDSVDLVSYLIKVAGCDINAKGFNGRTILHKACEKNHLGVVKYLITKMKCDLEAGDRNSDRPLHIACALSGSMDLVRYLINVAGCDINARGFEGRTILHKACEKNHLGVVKYLVTVIKCSIEAEDRNGDRPLHIACAVSGSVELVRYLIKVAGCDINARGFKGCTILHKACKKNCFEVVKFLINEIKCDIEAEDGNGNRPLHIACAYSGSVDLVRYLIKIAGCDIKCRGENKKTCLHFACERDDYDIVKVITAQPHCDLEAKDDYFNEPLQLSFNNLNICICKHLIQEITKRKRSENYLIDFLKIINGVTTQNNSNNEDEGGQLLLLAALNGDVENLDILFYKGDFDVNFKGVGGYTLLHCACASNNLACVEFLTSQINCNVQVQNDDHDRPLHIASCFGNVDITRHLVEIAGCDINSKGNHGYSPLHNACNRSHLEVVQFLTSQTNCNVEVEDDNCDRPLHIASYIGNMDIVMCLVNVACCDINAKGSNGYTALHQACDKSNLQVVKFLTTQSNCNINEHNDDNDQPFHIAARLGSIDIFKHLMKKASCDVNASGRNGYTPLHYACKHSSIEVIEYILDHPNFDTDILFLLDDHYEDENVQTVISFHKKFHQARKSTGVAYLRVVKCILTGPPGAGKSTLKKRLLNESLIEPSLSTGVVDAAVLVNSFRKIQQEVAIVPGLQNAIESIKQGVPSAHKIQEGVIAPSQNVAEWNKQTIDEEAVFILESLSSTKSSYKTSSYGMSSSLTAFVRASHGNRDDPLKRQSTVVENDPNSCRTMEDFTNQQEETIAGEKREQDNLANLKVIAINALSEIVQTIPVPKRSEYEKKARQISQDNHAMLHIIDTGGQPEFHEILPALITGPAINLLVFKLTEDLTSRYHITYRSPTGESQPYETSLTHEEVIFRSLASIACLRQNTIGWSFKESPLDDDSEAAAFLVATHRDQVDHSKVTEVNEQLKAKIQNSNLFHENLVQFASPDQLIHAIDTKKDQTEIEKLRSMLHKVISDKFHELPIPVSWSTFSVKLRKIDKSLHDINSCYKLALECGITDKEDFMFALWFLHHRVGSIMYYPEVNGLKDIVITNLQLVFDHITHLITSCFTFKSSGNAALENEFRTTGQFTEENIIKLSKKSDDPLSPAILVSLLRHLHIVAGPMSIKSGLKSGSYYFMPCALKPATVEQRYLLMCPAPLLIYFECGYCPVGVFCCLVVYLLSSRQQSDIKWALGKPPHFRNKIRFTVGKYYHQVILISRATYLEVWADSTIRMGTALPFYEIYQTLDKAMKTVTQSLHYMYKSCHFFGFPCTTCQSAPHPAICEYDDPAFAKCVQGGEAMSLVKKHTIWLKVCLLFTSINVILLCYI